ncbi:MAG: hypothetical protein H0V76_03025 [Blastocatellia bacterium]|nr:hypothetical protein [Blastocatellia bacterium]
MKIIAHKYVLNGAKRRDEQPLFLTCWFRRTPGNDNVPGAIWLEGECRDESCVAELESLKEPVLGLECDDDDVFHLNTIQNKTLTDTFRHAPTIVISDPICDDPGTESAEESQATTFE